MAAYVDWTKNKIISVGWIKILNSTGRWWICFFNPVFQSDDV